MENYHLLHYLLIISLWRNDCDCIFFGLVWWKQAVGCRMICKLSGIWCLQEIILCLNLQKANFHLWLKVNLIIQYRPFVCRGTL